eukprot:COSAG02_NODE_3208_length_7162_cov_236.150538_1_plen_73_part_00
MSCWRCTGARQYCITLPDTGRPTGPAYFAMGAQLHFLVLGGSLLDKYIYECYTLAQGLLENAIPTAVANGDS